MTIGVITICLNSEKTIRKTLDSIVVQTVQPDEVIIIDGGSKDNTLRVFQEYSNLPFRIISEKDKGIYNAMNKGLKLSEADVVGFLNSDDEFCNPFSIEKIKSAFTNNRKTKVFISGVDYLKNDGSISRKWRLQNIGSFKAGWHPPHPGFYAERNLLINLKGFNEKYRIASDFDLMLRAFLAIDSSEVIVDREKIVNMYLGGASNASFRNILRGNREIRIALASSGYKVTILYTIKRFARKILSVWSE